ncbi:hypothetical protein PHLCEN_2v749 [Hermanssonia centrifuga]|uniref:Uncharacterized protein n=1 Tax=Hermanssonia centrifuga TaxID=98765 RepID=A0A2R6S586_9APHY|nr:hypothetical protein PHLCEN_2v749 [Hermanssonia centrifuga]
MRAFTKYAMLLAAEYNQDGERGVVVVRESVLVAERSTSIDLEAISTNEPRHGHVHALCKAACAQELFVLDYYRTK